MNPRDNVSKMSKPRALFLEVKRPGREADHSRPTKNAFSYAYTRPYSFMAFYLIKQRDNLTFTSSNTKTQGRVNF
jgi:hypothetical protein